MRTSDHVPEKLGELLLKNEASIASAWANELADLPQVKALHLGAGEMQALAVEGLKQFRKDLVSPDGKETGLPAYSNILDGVDLDPTALVEALWQCRKAILPFIQASPLYQHNALAIQLDNHLGRVTLQLVRRLTDELHERYRQASDRTALIMDIARLAGSSLDLSEVLTQAGKAIATAAGADYCSFLLLNNEEELLSFTPDNIQLPDGFPGQTNSLVKIPREYLSPTDAIWEVLKEKHPVPIPDTQSSPKATHVAELQKMGVKSSMQVPCLVKGDVVAIALVATFKEYRNFSPDEIELAWTIATIVAPAIKNASLLQKVEQLAAIEERARLARSMHDNLSQTLGVLQMKASLTGELLLKDSIEAARASVNELGEIVRAAYTDVREEIFNLRTKTPGGKNFILYLRQYLATYQTSFAIKIALQADDSMDSRLDAFSADQVIYIIQEVLTNIRKHAQAELVEIRLELVGDKFQVEIQDNGIGFDPSKAGEDQDWRHFGMLIMQERAAAAGGMVEVDSQPGQGTRVRLSVPVRDIEVWNPTKGEAKK